jgi:hypothetical protein
MNEFQRLGVGVIAVAMSRPERLAAYLAEQPLPFPLLGDPERRAYVAFQLGRTTWGRMLRPAIGWRFLKAVLRGGRLRGVPKGEDPLQIGGDFLIGLDHQILWVYASPDPTDRPSVDRLLAEARVHLAVNKTP